MSFRKVILGFALMVAMAAVTGPSFGSDKGRDASVVTFNQPVEIPGVVLAPGTYVFQSIGPVVQVWDVGKITLFATLTTIPAYRCGATDKPEFEFKERVAGSPKAIEAWYIDRGSVGQEFVYAKFRAPEPPFPNTTFWASPSTRWWVELD
jgi:hypothetical protein